MFLSLEANGASDQLRVIRKVTAVVNPIKVACFLYWGTRCVERKFWSIASHLTKRSVAVVLKSGESEVGRDLKSGPRSVETVAAVKVFQKICLIAGPNYLYLLIVLIVNKIIYS